MVVVICLLLEQELNDSRAVEVREKIITSWNTFPVQEVCLLYMSIYRHNSLLIRNRSWILRIHKDRIFWKNLLENKEMNFKNEVKNIQAAGYNGARTVAEVAF